MTKAFFIPLNGEHYDAFINGTKRRGRNGFMAEFRLAGGAYNARTCTPGRWVTLSRGYSKEHRVAGEVRHFYESVPDAQHPEFLAIYEAKALAKGVPLVAAVIEVEVFGYRPELRDLMGSPEAWRLKQRYTVIHIPAKEVKP